MGRKKDDAAPSKGELNGMARFLGRQAVLDEPLIDDEVDDEAGDSDETSDDSPRVSKKNGRRFQERWVELNPHVRYDPSSKKMYCLSCGERPPLAKMEGLKTMKASAVKEHVCSASHQALVGPYEERLARDERNETAAPPADPDIREGMTLARSALEDSYCVKMRGLGYLLDKGSPFSQCAPRKP